MSPYADPFSPLPWFALRVKSKHEKKVAEILRCLGQQPFLPLFQERHRWSQRWAQLDLPLFPGYVFCRFERAAWPAVANTPGVIDAVRCGKTLAIVDSREIESLRLAQSAACPMLPTAYLAAGSWIELQTGPLAGARGRVLCDEGEEQLVLSVDLLQRSVRVKVDREWIMELQEPAAFTGAPSNSHVFAKK